MIVWLYDCMIVWLIDSMIVCMYDWLIDCMYDCMIVGLYDRLYVWLYVWLIVWLYDCMIVGMIVCMIDCMIVCMIDCMIVWLYVWLYDCRYDCMIVCVFAQMRDCTYMSRVCWWFLGQTQVSGRLRTSLSRGARTGGRDCRRGSRETNLACDARCSPGCCRHVQRFESRGPADRAHTSIVFSWRSPRGSSRARRYVVDWSNRSWERSGSVRGSTWRRSRMQRWALDCRWRRGPTEGRLAREAVVWFWACLRRCHPS